jgi:peptidoglycan/xylan/chitin deacetylase (PgdA/CDA1 family)
MKSLVLRAGFEALHLAGAARFLRDTGAGVILTLHHVREAAPRRFAPNAELEITPATLDLAIEALRAAGFDCVALDAVPDRLAEPGARPFAAFTLDDGYRDNREIAAPVFRRHGVPYCVFVTSGFVERSAILWWEVVEAVLDRAARIRFDFGAGPEILDIDGISAKERAAARILPFVRKAEPRQAVAAVKRLAEENGVDPMGPTEAGIMSVAELVDLAADPLCTIGAHTVTHPNLARLSAEDAAAEMREGADRLEAWLGRRPRHFSYPYGQPTAAGEREFRLAAGAGFDLAVTTRPGMLRPAHAGALTALPRVSLNGRFQARRHVELLVSGAPFALMERLKGRAA